MNSLLLSAKIRKYLLEDVTGKGTVEKRGIWTKLGFIVNLILVLLTSTISVEVHEVGMS